MTPESKKMTKAKKRSGAPRENDEEYYKKVDRNRQEWKKTWKQLKEEVAKGDKSK